MTHFTRILVFKHEFLANEEAISCVVPGRHISVGQMSPGRNNYLFIITGFGATVSLQYVPSDKLEFCQMENVRHLLFLFGKCPTSKNIIIII